MNVKKYIIFREVSKTENFTQAAKNLFITQSAVSHAIKELEEQAGTKLFERLHKSVKLTKTGELLLAEVLPMLGEFEQLERKIKNIEEEAPIRIASCITIAQIWLPQIIKRFSEQFPKTVIEVDVNSAAFSLESLKRGEADLAFLEGPISGGTFLVKQFAAYHLCAVAAPDYCLPSELSLKQLTEESLLLRERGSAVREMFESTITLAGLKTYPIWTSVDSQTLIEAAKSGLGIAVLPEVLIASELAAQQLKKIRIKDTDMRNELTMVLNKNKYQSQSLKKFWELL